MGMFDRLKDLAEKAMGTAGSQADKVDPLIDKAGQTIDEKTGGKFSGQVGAASDAAKKAMREQGGGQEQAGHQSGE
ncbi:antitoxin [Nocardia sp. NEAU-G5]|uniref:Antitoxin n=1 Tax=Nocardia albiluteola TaxID=2842303 RepID=A0ABS6ART4_9NOCA|nr:antitoxin [Nocardia albiluteola]MBU3060739.1 antitoxin [Nocardia albiluteola]